MSRDSIRLSPKHGVNPSLMQCFYCGGDVGVALVGLMKGDRKAPHKAVYDMQPCDQCAHFMKDGVILIEVDEAKTTEKENPYRAGGWAVVKAEAIERMVTPPELRDHILKKRVAFIPTDAWDALGLPRGGGTHPEPEPGKDKPNE